MSTPALEALIRGEALDERDMVFQAPWQARAFAIVLTLAKRGNYEWEEFRQALISEISATPASAPDGYYDQFLRALEKVLASKGIVGGAEIARRVKDLTLP
jgi:nitrile hydratase accessory protein